MIGATTGPPVLVMSTSWLGHETELSFITRAIAGAASRHGAVTVVTPTPSGMDLPDGAFELRGIGRGRGGGWPDPGETRWVPPPDPKSTWVFDQPGEAAAALFKAFGGGSATYSVRRGDGAGVTGMMPLPLLPGTEPGLSGVLDVYVPVNPLAATSRHGGLGFADYLLVLSDRPATPAVSPPTAAVAWLTARFHRRHVVVIEGGSAAVWKGRALRGVVGVETRIDLWRLMAHAFAMVDLAPGDIIARECIESLRFGTPILIPSDAPGAAHAHAGGGFTFSGAPELLERVEQLLDRSERELCSRRGAEYANSRYGDSPAFVTGVARALHLAG
jgi:hypothetical protein